MPRDDFSQRWAGEALKVTPYSLGRIHAGEKSRLASSTLRQPTHAKQGICGDTYPPFREWA
jgi:hypothetical protein